MYKPDKYSDRREIILFFPDTEEKKEFAPPLPLLALAAVLEPAGYKVHIIDQRLEKEAEKKILSLLDKCIAIGISSLSGPQIKYGLEISEMIKETDPDFPVIWGGWHVSILPEQSLENPLLDIVVQAQGELTLLELLDTIKQGKYPENVEGLFWKKDGKIIKNNPRKLVQLDEFPPLAFHLIDLKDYPSRKEEPDEIFTIYRTSMGCPYRCAFCADPLVLKRKWVSLSAERTIQEVKNLVDNYGVTTILFIDDTFFVNKKRVLEIANGFIDQKIKIKWQGLARTGMIVKFSDEEWLLLKKSGCDLIHPGIEAPTQKMLDYILKDEKHENTFLAAKKLAKAGIRALYSFIIAFPDEPEDSIEKTFEVIRELKEIDHNNIMPVNFYTPYPGNVLYYRALKEGFEEPKSLVEWADFNTRFGKHIPWVTQDMRQKVMMRDKFYIPAAYPSETLKKRMNKGILKYLYRFFHKISKWRVQNNNFKFPIEWKILYRYWRIWGSLNRTVKLPDIKFR